MYITWTDPLIPDGHIDTDGDGLTNAVECSFGTNADDKDTDNDRISDYDEIFLYQTDPLTKDGDDLNADEQDAPSSRSLYMIGSGIIDPDIHEYEGGGYTEPVYSGVLCDVLTGELLMSPVSYKLNYSWFGHSNTTYNQDLAVVSSVACALAYYGNYITIGGDELVTTGENAIEEWMEYHGMTYYWKCNLNEFDYGDCHMSEMHIARRQTTINGVTKNLVAVVIRGTYDGLNEWQSNFDVGSTSDFSLYDEWTNITNHRGFDITANRLEEHLECYLDTLPSGSEYTLWITGHSRGGALANILAAKRVSAGDNVFCYTFASPKTTTADDAISDSYDCIYNIINEDDLVCRLPLESWGFQRYGNDKPASIEESYAAEWDDLLVNQATYTSNLTGVENTIARMGEISSSQNGCYTYRTDSSGYVRFLASSELDRDVFLTGQLQMYPKNVNGYYRYETVDNWPTYSVDIYQTPAFFMQLLAATMAQEVNYFDFTFIDVAPYLQQTKHSLMWLSIWDNIDYPHFCESYYLLATQVT